MSLKVDFTEAEGFPLIELGLYDVVCTKVEQKESQAGNQYFQFDFRIVGSEWNGMFAPSIRNMIDAKDKNYYLKQTLEALDYQVSGVADVEPSDLVNRRAKMQITHREYQGKLVADVGGLYPPDDDFQSTRPTESNEGASDEIPW